MLLSEIDCERLGPLPSTRSTPALRKAQVRRLASRRKTASIGGVIRAA
jgi:hypothetical protein